MIDSRVLEQLIRVQIDAGCSRKLAVILHRMLANGASFDAAKAAAA